MTLPVSGAISFNNINVELGVSGTTQASLGQSSYRTLAGVPSGAISMSNFYGKANQFSLTISSNQTNANLRTLAVNAGWNQSTKVVATIGSGVYISSNSTGTPALTISGSFPGGVELINNGYIVGMGGAGGAGRGIDNYAAGVGGSAGSSGGLALSASSAISITNNGTIGGGGGGGGGGQARYYYVDLPVSVTGGGGGGGRTGTTNSSGGSGGSNSSTYPPYSGKTGGVGTASSAGTGGDRGYAGSSLYAGAGGNGGGWGSAGSTGGTGIGGTDKGGPFGGGSAGGAVTGNSNITWIATGTRLGSIS